MTTLWAVYDPGATDIDAEFYGVFTSEDKARRAAVVCDPCRPGICLSVEPIVVDAIYKTDRTRHFDGPNFFYRQPEPDTDWDHMVVTGALARPGLPPPKD